MLVDTHCHLFREYYDDIDMVLNNAYQNGVVRVIVNGTNEKDNLEVLELISKYDSVYGALGIQPEEINDQWEETLTLIEKHLNDNKIIAIGEIGLDYHYDCNKELQKNVFRKQLELAEKYNMPVIIHSRDSIQDTYDILREFHVKGIMHCYSGSVEMAHRFTELGFYLGIGGICTFKNSIKIKEVIKSVDLAYLLLETDSPYLSPEPYRGKRNEPANIPYILRKICEIKDIDYSKGMLAIEANIERLFDKKLNL